MRGEKGQAWYAGPKSAQNQDAPNSEPRNYALENWEKKYEDYGGEEDNEADLEE